MNFPTVLQVKPYLDAVYSAWKLAISQQENSWALAQQLGNLTIS